MLYFSDTQKNPTLVRLTINGYDAHGNQIECVGDVGTATWTGNRFTPSWEFVRQTDGHTLTIYPSYAEPLEPRTNEVSYHDQRVLNSWKIANDQMVDALDQYGEDSQQYYEASLTEQEAYQLVQERGLAPRDDAPRSELSLDDESLSA